MNRLVLLALCGMAWVLAGCEQRQANGPTSQPGATAGAAQAGTGGKRTIAVIPKGTTHEFWKSIHAGANKAAQEIGCEIIWKGPVREDESASQIATVEDMMSTGVSGIVLAPNDASALARVVDRANQQKVPVVIIDSDVNSQNYKSFVATDNHKGGQMAGEHLAQLLGGKGKVILLRYQEGSASTEKREAGFLDAMKKHPKIQIVSMNQYAGATSDSAQKAAENLLAAYKNADGSLAVDGVFTPNESSTYGMLLALRAAKGAGTVKFVGFDASEKLVDALQVGEIHGLILQDPVNMGYLGVKTMVAVLDGKTVEKRIDTGVHLATKQNLATPEIEALIAPQWEKFGVK
ncbi:MAG TPA: substrate-binding domain-containing protein [Tepidisphaeraceae bacterium]|jgi:ribose transport system substrate-binding protein